MMSDKVKTKLKIRLFALYDYDGIKAEVEKMARQGWLMEKIGSFYVRYRECPPVNLTCDIVFNRQNSESEEGMTERSAISGFFEDTGWEEVFTWRQATIFIKEEENAEPMYTDEAMKLQGIHTSMKKGYLRGYFGILIIMLWHALRDVYRVFFDPHREYYDINGTRELIVWSLALIILFSVFAYYYIWRWRSIRSVSRGGRCMSTALSSYIKNTVAIISVMTLIYAVAFIPPISVKWRIMLAGLILVNVVIGTFLYELYLKELEMGISERKNRAVAAALLIVLIAGLIIFGSIFMNYV